MPNLCSHGHRHATESDAKICSAGTYVSGSEYVANLNPKTQDAPSIASGKSLFEAGCTIQNAARFLDMNRDNASIIDNEYGLSPHPDELVEYFEWEIESMTLFMRSRFQEPGAFCVVCGTPEQSTAWGIAAPYPPTGEYRCVSCGAHYRDNMGRLELRLVRS